jgi:catechol 2,3-dioxygenase-like lactoylglutathione lyase family enzyme
VSDVEIDNLRYVGVSVPDYAVERSFVANVWGLPEVATDADVSYFAAEGSSNAYVYRVRSAPERALDVISFALRNEAAVDRKAERLAASGVRLISQPHRLNEPGGGYGFRFFDLDGRTIELSSGLEERPARVLARGESVPASLSHVVLHTSDVKKTVAFYEQHLGLRVSDWLGEFMCFMRCNSVHHCIAFIPGPTALNHVAFEMRDLDELMRGVARLSKENVVLGWGPGRHTAGNNVFSYFLAPSGNVLEYTAEMQRIDEASWRPTVYTPSPDITDRWGTGSLDGRGIKRLGAPVPDPGLWKAAPR